MKLINQSFEILEQPDGFDGILKMCEIAGRVCYKSEDKITDTSAKDFVDMIVRRGHYAVLEHNDIQLTVPVEPVYSPEIYTEVQYLIRDKYTHHILNSSSNGKATYTFNTNLRVIKENGLMDIVLDYLEPSCSKNRRISVKFISSRAIANELVRHRVFSFCQESTRYCNYSLNKFDNEITFIKPAWYNEEYSSRVLFRQLCFNAETTYMSLLDAGKTPQQARDVLPLCLKTELVMTGHLSDWKAFFDLRCSSAAHPDMKNLVIPLRNEFIERNYL